MMLQRQTIFLSFVLTSAMVALAPGCSDDTEIPRRGTTSSSSSSGSMTAGGNGGNATGGIGGTGGSEVGGMGGGAFGSVDIVDVGDSPCSLLQGAVVELYPDNSKAPALNRLFQVAGKRVAGGRYVPGFVTFGLDGSFPSASVVGLDLDFDLIASEGTTIGLATAASNAVRFQRYGADEAPIGTPVPLGAAVGAGMAIAGDDATGGSIVIWADPMNMNARFVNAAGVASPAFTFAEGLSTKAVTTSATKSGTSFAVAWSTVENGTAHARFARLTSSGLVGSIVDIAGPAYSLYVLKLITTPNGHALLLHSGNLAFDTLVVLLDVEGHAVGPARRFLGTTYAMDIAPLGNNFGLLAKRADGAAAFRLLDGAATASGAWKCLDAPSDDVLDQAGIDADGTGWAIVYRTPLGGEKFVRTNLTGTGAP